MTNSNWLWIFDLDGTLVQQMDEDGLHQTVIRWMEAVKPKRVAIASNQGGVGMRYWREPRPEDGYDGFGGPVDNLPTEAKSAKRMEKVAQQIRKITGGEVRWYAAYRYRSGSGNWSTVPQGREDDPMWSKEWRKPEPGMLLQAMADFGVSSDEAIFCGNFITDQRAAEAAGIPYIDADELFAMPVTLTYPKSWVCEWLPVSRREGLDHEASRARLEEMLLNQLNMYWRVNGSVVQVDATVDSRGRRDDDRFELSDGSEAVVLASAIKQAVRDMFINRDWLVFDSADAHARALHGTPWFLAGSLAQIYGYEAGVAAWEAART